MNTVKKIVLMFVVIFVTFTALFLYQNMFPAGRNTTMMSTTPYRNQDNWVEATCTADDGTNEMYQIPLPTLEGFSEEFTQEYTEEAVRNFCSSIKDDTEYVK